MTLGERIAALRNQHELSQGALAELMNVSRQSISKWETNASVPELDKLIQLSEVFHISLDELVKSDIPPAHTVLEDTEPTYTTPHSLRRSSCRKRPTPGRSLASSYSVLAH